MFASNVAGIHKRGTARVARLNFRAASGVGSGPTGDAYALTTFDRDHVLLPPDRIEHEVAAFLGYARDNHGKNFFVTRIACAPGQLADRTMAALFSGASANCSLPQLWMPFVSAPLAASHRLCEKSLKESN